MGNIMRIPQPIAKWPDLFSHLCAIQSVGMLEPSALSSISALSIFHFACNDDLKLTIQAYC